MAVLCGVLASALLSAVLPGPLRSTSRGQVLETVAPSQLAAIGLRLEPTLQPVELPDAVARAGIRLPGTLLLRSEAESVLRRSVGGLQETVESSLTYATTTRLGARSRGTTIVHRLVWVIVGSRIGARASSGVLPMLWLVDARSPRLLIELAVPAVTGPAPPA